MKTLSSNEMKDVAAIIELIAKLTDEQRRAILNIITGYALAKENDVSTSA